jgi:hypothetical protein
MTDVRQRQQEQQQQSEEDIDALLPRHQRAWEQGQTVAAVGVALPPGQFSTPVDTDGEEGTATAGAAGHDITSHHDAGLMSASRPRHHTASKAASWTPPGGEYGGSSFLVTSGAGLPPSMAELLAEFDDLAPYAAAFEEAKISPSLARDMSAADMRAVLPGAPFGDCLRIRRVVASAREKTRMMVPKAPSLQALGRIVGAAYQDGEMGSSLITQLEFLLVCSSLLLSITAPYAMEPVQQCSDTSDCRTLRVLDSILWTASTSFFLGSVVTSWITFMCYVAVSKSQLAKWYEDNYFYVKFGMMLFVAGITAIPCAFVTRVLIVTHGDTFPRYLKWLVACVFGSGMLLEYWFWFQIGRKTFGVSTCEFIGFHWGALGMYTPRKKLNGEWRHDPPYFDEEFA